MFALARTNFDASPDFRCVLDRETKCAAKKLAKILAEKGIIRAE